mmetsp:Transcript_22023/g.47881  ORF Transcript_22023/g.47881 Transcript_22023/m.47881 type:complete len:202 (-) Transcript_22023:1712-2317(-)
MHARSRWKDRLGPICMKCTRVCFTNRLISIIVGLTISCNPIPGRRYRANKGLGTRVPEGVNSPVKKVIKTSRKKIVFTAGTRMVAMTWAAISQVCFEEVLHVMSSKLLTTGIKMEGAVALLFLPSQWEDAFKTLKRNLSSGIFFSSPESMGAKIICDISKATHASVKYFHSTAKEVLGLSSSRFFSFLSDSLCLVIFLLSS